MGCLQAVGGECGLIGGDCGSETVLVGAECEPKTTLVCEPTAHCLQAATATDGKNYDWCSSSSSCMDFPLYTFGSSQVSAGFLPKASTFCLTACSTR
jgi:hypothetical protein